jgi:hypothetical protein
MQIAKEVSGVGFREVVAVAKLSFRGLALPSQIGLNDQPCAGFQTAAAVGAKTIVARKQLRPWLHSGIATKTVGNERG